jgi:hypothetical protein
MAVIFTSTSTYKRALPTDLIYHATPFCHWDYADSHST